MKNKIKILLTGGTGQLGKMFLKRMDNGYSSIDVLTRNRIIDSTKNMNCITADLSKPETLSVLKTDYDVVVHCASSPTESDSIDVGGTGNLLKAINSGNAKNLIYISIIGVDKTMYKYYQNKLKAEALIIDSGIPYTILRITQFHDFVHDRILNPTQCEGGLFAIPTGLKFQSIDLIDVCEEIQKSIKNKPTNSILQIGGPEILEIQEIVEVYQNVIAADKKITMTSTLNDFQKLFTTGINLCPDYKIGKITWRDYLLNKRNVQ